MGTLSFMPCSQVWGCVGLFAANLQTSASHSFDRTKFLEGRMLPDKDSANCPCFWHSQGSCISCSYFKDTQCSIQLPEMLISGGAPKVWNLAVLAWGLNPEP